MDRRACLGLFALGTAWLACGCGRKPDAMHAPGSSNEDGALPRRGVNLAGAEFGHDKPGFCAEERGAFGKDWTHPTEGTIAYFARHGLRLLRVPFRWERLQPRLGHELDPHELARLRKTLDLARGYGSRVLLDAHNYGRYALKVGDAARTCRIDEELGGRVPVSRAHFGDLWRRVAQAFARHEALEGYGLMNEPHEMGDADWKVISNEGVRALREVDASHPVYVAGEHWSSSWKWTEANGARAWIDDPAGKVVYEAHCYFDADGSGTYPRSFEAELAADPDLLDRGVARLADFAGWCARNRVRGFLGEYGVPRDDARWHEVAERFLARLDALGMDSCAWAAGEWWGSYPLSLQPGHAFVTDAPFLRRLKRKRA
jgi:endoglucanase